MLRLLSRDNDIFRSPLCEWPHQESASPSQHSVSFAIKIPPHFSIRILNMYVTLGTRKASVRKKRKKDPDLWARTALGFILWRRLIFYWNGLVSYLQKIIISTQWSCVVVNILKIWDFCGRTGKDDRVSISPKIFLRSAVLMAVAVIVTFLWKATPCRCVGWYRPLGGTCCLHLYGRRDGSKFYRKFSTFIQTTRCHIPEYLNLGIFHFPLFLSRLRDSRNCTFRWVKRFDCKAYHI